MKTMLAAFAFFLSALFAADARANCDPNVAFGCSGADSCLTIPSNFIAPGQQPAECTSPNGSFCVSSCDGWAQCIDGACCTPIDNYDACKGATTYTVPAGCGGTWTCGPTLESVPAGYAFGAPFSFVVSSRFPGTAVQGTIAKMGGGGATWSSSFGTTDSSGRLSFSAPEAWMDQVGTFTFTASVAGTPSAVATFTVAPAVPATSRGWSALFALSLATVVLAFARSKARAS